MSADDVQADARGERFAELIARLCQFRVQADHPGSTKGEPGEFVQAVSRGDIQIGDAALRSMILQKDPEVRTMILEAVSNGRREGQAQAPSVTAEEAMFFLRSIYGVVQIGDLTTLMGR